MRTVVIAGHVDHGKSTLIGKLLTELGQVRQDKVDYVSNICRSRGVPVEPAFFLDALEEEQAQGITIDTTRVSFDYRDQRFLLIDAPGHLDFLKNMSSGASHAEHGVLVIDAQEGVRAQTRRHLQLFSILGIERVMVLINKMDRVQFSQDIFDTLAIAARRLLTDESLTCTTMIPICAFHGDNVANPSASMQWYLGSTFLESLFDLCTVKAKSPQTEHAPVRMILQDVYKFDDRRYFAGRVLTGSITPGAEICFSPSGKIAKVESLQHWPAGIMHEASAGASVALVLSDQVFVERGEVISLVHERPHVDTKIAARLAWIGSSAFNPDETYTLKIGTKQTSCRLEIDNSDPVDDPQPLRKGDCANVLIHASVPIAFDSVGGSHSLNKLVICNSHDTLAFGVVQANPTKNSKSILVNPNVYKEVGFVERGEKESRQKHRGAVLWLTGLSGSGKSTLARALERRLFNQDVNVGVLDGDNIRHGLCADLGFSPEDRSENVRRLAHAAKLMAENGHVCIVAAIAPYELDRNKAKAIVGPDDYNEIFVFCPLEVCQQRDSKGLYKRVSTGQISSFTGIDVPYQMPRSPELRIDTSKQSVDQEVDQILQLMEKKGIITGKDN